MFGVYNLKVYGTFIVPLQDSEYVQMEIINQLDGKLNVPNWFLTVTWRITYNSMKRMKAKIEGTEMK
jgi:hypothetical protein